MTFSKNFLDFFDLYWAVNEWHLIVGVSQLLVLNFLNQNHDSVTSTSSQTFVKVYGIFSPFFFLIFQYDRVLTKAFLQANNFFSEFKYMAGHSSSFFFPFFAIRHFSFVLFLNFLWTWVTLVFFRVFLFLFWKIYMRFIILIIRFSKIVFHNLKIVFSKYLNYIKQ